MANGTVLTPKEIAVYAKGAGFSGDALVWAVAIALAESGGRTNAVATNKDKWQSKDRGLWQINSHWHPEVTDAQAYSPASAAAAAYKISNGGKSWSAWATYTNGSASAQLSRARIGAEQAAGTATGTTDDGSTATGTVGPVVPDDLLGQLQSAARTLAMIGSTWIKAAEWISTPRNWVRVLEVGGGAVLVVLALVAMSRSGAGPLADAMAVPQKITKDAAGAIVGAAKKVK